MEKLFKIGTDSLKVITLGFLVAVEVQEGMDNVTFLRQKLADALTWVEGVGKVGVECMGEIDVYDEEIHKAV